MPSPRWLARFTIPMMAGAALVSSAAIATANPADDAYLAKLRAVGLTWPPNTEEALIGEAHLICYDLTWGWTPQQIADDIHAHLDKRGVTLLDVGTNATAERFPRCRPEHLDARCARGQTDVQDSSQSEVTLETDCVRCEYTARRDRGRGVGGKP